MKDPETDNLSFKRFDAVRRKPLILSEAELVKISAPDSGRKLPLLVQPAVSGVNLIEWARNNRGLINNHLLRSGALLFRGFGVKTAPQFEQLVEAISDELLDYNYGSTPRSLVTGKIYTSTEYPAEQTIPLHNEMSYSTEWPLKIWFFCLKPAANGGETPIADSRRVLARISAPVKERFHRSGVMYVRNYGDGLDLSWRQVFQTTSKDEVERFCRRGGIEFEWGSHDRLRTKQVCQAVIAHPVTNEPVWFNQAHLFHPSGLDTKVRQSLLTLYREEDLTRNAYYGDGAPIEDSALDEIRSSYRAEAIPIPWQEYDILLLDNMLTAHGREPYSGARRVLVGMAELFINRATQAI